MASAGACGEGDDLGDKAAATVPFVFSAPLSDDTAVAVFALGRGSDFQPWSAEGTLSAAPPPEATVVFREVPEGDFHAGFAGYANRAFAEPNPGFFPSEAWCLRDVGDLDISLVSGGRGYTTLTATATVAECLHTGFDRYAVNPDYEADPEHPFFGSADGGNVVALYLDAWGDQAPLEVDVDTGSGPAPFGLFEALPDTTGGGTWPDVAAWNGQSLLLTADAGGDARCYLVIHPEALPVLWEVSVTQTQSGDSAHLRIWVKPKPAPGPGCTPADCNDGIACTSDHCKEETWTCEWVPDDAACDDDNLCTEESCDPVEGCIYSELADGTACGDGLLCHAGECVPGELVWPTDDLTGDCANDGTATRHFAQLRCGNGAILGTPPLEIQRYAALSFDLSSVPSGYEIESANVHLYQEMVIGEHPYTPGGLEDVVAEQVSYTMLFGGCDDWIPIEGTIGQALVSESAGLGWYAVDITEAVRYGIETSLRRVQIRLRFLPSMTDGDGDDDLAVFASDNTTTPERVPFLLLHYPP